MSVWVRSLMPHQWARFSQANVEKLARAINPNAQIKLISDAGSAEKEFETSHNAFFLISGGYSLRLGARALEIGQDHRWSAFLMHPEVRREFLTACRETARICAASEMLLLPESTELEDLLFADTTFDQLKQSAYSKWGSPDLNILQFYTESQILDLGFSRVHYFLVTT